MSHPFIYAHARHGTHAMRADIAHASTRIHEPSWLAHQLTIIRPFEGATAQRGAQHAGAHKLVSPVCFDVCAALRSGQIRHHNERFKNPQTWPTCTILHPPSMFLLLSHALLSKFSNPLNHCVRALLSFDPNSESF
jgi:hypothetical protein